jgi:hypothetical protein
MNPTEYCDNRKIVPWTEGKGAVPIINYLSVLMTELIHGQANYLEAKLVGGVDIRSDKGADHAIIFLPDAGINVLCDRLIIDPVNGNFYFSRVKPLIIRVNQFV